MQLIEFITKCVVVTMCLFFLIFSFCNVMQKPKYQFLDKETRVNLYTGERELWSNHDWTWNKR